MTSATSTTNRAETATSAGAASCAMGTGRWPMAEDAELKAIDLTSITRRPDRVRRMMMEHTNCHAAKDGECFWEHCPQNRDNESHSSGRH